MRCNFSKLVRSDRPIMKTRLMVGGVIVVLFCVGCTDREAAARKAKEDAEAKARADAARKEMDALPKAFKSRDYFKQNEPEKKPAAATEKQQPKP